MSFETFERGIRQQLARALGEGGFDPARDIDAIFVNRWPHGYAGAGNDLFDPDWGYDELSVKINGANMEGAIADVQRIWNELVPSWPFQYSFLDEHFAELYRSDQQMQSVVKPYEQKVILGLVVLVLISVLWLGAWKPVSDWRALEVNRQQNAQRFVDWLRANEQKAKEAATRPAGGRSGTPIAVITKAAAANDITVNRLVPESNGVISVNLQAQSFNKIIAWIAQLEENNGVSVERASFDGQDAPGYVNAQVRFN